jgi:hypothetical protein
MSYGFQVLNNNGFVQFDTSQELKHLVKVQSYTISVGARTLKNYSYSFYGSAYGNDSGPIIKSPPSGLGTEVVRYSGGVQQRYFLQNNILLVRPSSRAMYPCAISWSSEGEFYCYSQVAGSFIIDEYEYAGKTNFNSQVAALGTNRHALQVFDTNGDVTFDSGLFPTRIAGINSLNYPNTTAIPPSGLLNNKLDKSLHIFDASPFPDSGEDHEFPHDQVKTTRGLRWAASANGQDRCSTVELVAEYGFSSSPDYVEYFLFIGGGSTPIVLNSGTAAQTSTPAPAPEPAPATPSIVSVTPNPNSVYTTEGLTRYFTVVTQNVPSGTVLDWVTNYSNHTTNYLDWGTPSGQVTIGANNYGTFFNQTVDDSTVEGNETYTVTVSGVVNGTAISKTSAVQTIVDNDSAPAPEPEPEPAPGPAPGPAPAPEPETQPGFGGTSGESSGLTGET